jgi:hippurate hydrolase
MPVIEAGHIGVRAGPVMAGSDDQESPSEVSGGHGSMPHKGTNAKITAAQFIVASQTLVSREVNHFGSGSCQRRLYQKRGIPDD